MGGKKRRLSQESSIYNKYYKLTCLHHLPRCYIKSWGYSSGQDESTSDLTETSNCTPCLLLEDKLVIQLAHS